MNSKLIIIYILKLECGKYYVGQSKNFHERIKKHFSGQGSAWTKKYSPIEILTQRELSTSYWRDALEIENELTLELMILVGWENVRGGNWSTIQLKNKPQALEYLPSQTKLNPNTFEFKMDSYELK